MINMNKEDKYILKLSKVWQSDILTWSLKYEIKNFIIDINVNSIVLEKNINSLLIRYRIAKGIRTYPVFSIFSITYWHSTTKKRDLIWSLNKKNKIDEIEINDNLSENIIRVKSNGEVIIIDKAFNISKFNLNDERR